MDDEDTNVMLRQSQRATRRIRLTVLGGVAAVAGLIVFWIATGPKACEQRMARDIMPEQPKVDAPAAAEKMSCVVDPAGTTATVFVTLAEQGLLWVDDAGLGVVTSKSVVLSPGTHTIRAEIKRTDMRQMLTVKAGEEFTLGFDREKKAIDLECARQPVR